MKEGNLRFEDLNIFYRETGSGPPIILLHCAGGASGQWRKFMNRMSDRFHLFAIDLPSHGRSDRMPADVDNEFDLEERLVAAIVDRAGQPAHLVGHSTGGSVAARVAIGSPDQVLSLSIYEPTLFQLLANGGDDEGWNDYLRLVTGMIDNFDGGNPEDAAAVMVDYWSKPKTFANLPSDQKRPCLPFVLVMRRGFSAKRHLGRCSGPRALR